MYGLIWTAECQDGPQNVEMDRRMSRWTAGCQDGPQNVAMVRKMSRWTAECQDGPQNVKMDRRMSRRTAECRDGPQNVAMESTPESTGPMTLLGPGPESGSTGFFIFFPPAIRRSCSCCKNIPASACGACASLVVLIVDCVSAPFHSCI